MGQGVGSAPATRDGAEQRPGPAASPADFVFNVTRPFEMPVLILADQPARPAPEWPILRWYLPAIAWGPLVIAVARDYRRRCAKSLLECPAAVGSR